jgi:hypothetical protein
MNNALKKALVNPWLGMPTLRRNLEVDDFCFTDLLFDQENRQRSDWYDPCHLRPSPCGLRITILGHGQKLIDASHTLATQIART